MKIVITEEQKKKLFVPLDLDKRNKQFKDEFAKKTKELLSRFNITEIMNHGRVNDIFEITAEDTLDGAYEKIIIDGKNYHGFPRFDDFPRFDNDEDEEIISEWEDMLATYLNILIPQPTEESLSKSEPSVVGRMYRVDITPKKIDVSFYYAIVEYTEKEGKESITL